MSQGSRYQRSAPAMVGAMIVTVAFVLIFVAWRALFRDPQLSGPEAVDWQESVELADQAGYAVARPSSMPSGWTATSVDLIAGDDPRWGLGILTKDGDFVGIRQADSSVHELVRTYVDEDAEAGEEASISSGVADVWETWSDEGGDLGYAAEIGDDSVLVYGSAPADEIDEFIASLTTR